MEERVLSALIVGGVLFIIISLKQFLKVYRFYIQNTISQKYVLFTILEISSSIIFTICNLIWLFIYRM